MTPSIKYRDDAPKILLMWILSLVLIILVIVIIILTTCICRARRKFSPAVAAAVEGREKEKEKVYLEQEFPHEKITRLSSTVRRLKDHQEPPLLLHNPKMSDADSEVGSSRGQSVLQSPLHPPLEPRYSADINECGLPTPLPLPALPLASQYFMRSKSVGFTRNRVRAGPRASIPRSIRKLHWEDVNNNNNTHYAEETMKSSGESVYF